MLPKQLRDLIWATYRPGQEVTKTPSIAYIHAAQQVQKWIAENCRRGPVKSDDSKDSRTE